MQVFDLIDLPYLQLLEKAQRFNSLRLESSDEEHDDGAGPRAGKGEGVEKKAGGSSAKQKKKAEEESGSDEAEDSKMENWERVFLRFKKFWRRIADMAALRAGGLQSSFGS